MTTLHCMYAPSIIYRVSKHVHKLISRSYDHINNQGRTYIPISHTYGNAALHVCTQFHRQSINTWYIKEYQDLYEHITAKLEQTYTYHIHMATLHCMYEQGFI